MAATRRNTSPRAPSARGLPPPVATSSLSGHLERLGGSNMLCKLLSVCAALTAALVFGSVPVLAQITTGTVTGSVKDPSGAVIPGATVVLTSEARGTKSAPTVTNETGDFVIPNVTPDTYSIEVTLQGFKTAQRGGIVVSSRRLGYYRDRARCD